MIEITRELLQKLYLEDGLTEAQIAERFGTYQVKVGRLRKKYGIPTITESIRIGLPTELPSRLRSLLVGSMLGDGGLQKIGVSSARFTEHHSVKQRDYLDWKVQEWGSFISTVIPSNKGEFKGFRFITHSCEALQLYFKMFYSSGQEAKTFVNLPVDWVDGLALAVWFMDDGSISGERYVRFSIGPRPEDQEAQISILKNLGIEGHLYTERNGDSIHIHDQTNMNRFLALVTPHIHPSMDYKIAVKTPKTGEAPRHFLTPVRLQPFLDSGISLQKISEDLEVPRTSVGRAVSKFKNQDFGPNLEFSSLTEESLRKLYTEDLKTDSEIGILYGMSDVLISQQRKRHGISTMSLRQRNERKGGCPSLDSLSKEKLEELCGSMSDSEIGTLYSTSKTTIRNRRNRFGVER